MSKELPYFRFTASEWLNDDISLEDYSIKGVFADICAYYWFKDCSITQAMLKKRFSNAEGMLKRLFDNGIIKMRNGDDYIEIKFLNEQYDQLSKSRKLRQNAGAKGGKKRSSIAKALLKQSSSYKDKDKDNNKDKEKDKKYIEDVELNSLFIDFLDMRRRIKKPATERAIELLLMDLEKISDKKGAIELSIKKNYQGLFEPNKNKNVNNYELTDSDFRKD